MNAIECRDLTKSYQGFTLDHITFTLPAGCILGLVGENGAGKTTTIKCILNLIRRDAGQITLLGQDNLSGETLAKADVGVVLDECYFHDTLRPRDIDRILSHVFSNWDSALFDTYLDKFQLPEGKYVKEFSRGMKMKLTIAAALSHQARLLVLDEATAGLDPIVRDEILDIFYEFTRDETHSVLISSHILSDLEKICDYIAFLHEGQLLFCEEKDALLETYGIFNDTAEQAEALMPEAVVVRETTPYGGVRALVRRALAPAGFRLEKPTIEDIILFLAKGEKK